MPTRIIDCVSTASAGNFRSLSLPSSKMVKRRCGSSGPVTGGSVGAGVGVGASVGTAVGGRATIGAFGTDVGTAVGAGGAVGFGRCRWRDDGRLWRPAHLLTGHLEEGARQQPPVRQQHAQRERPADHDHECAGDQASENPGHPARADVRPEAGGQNVPLHRPRTIHQPVRKPSLRHDSPTRVTVPSRFAEESDVARTLAGGLDRSGLARYLSS